jgi:DNA modification methylase
MESSQFQDFLADAFAVADKHLKPGGAFYIWHASWWVSDLNAAARRTGWDIKQTIIWNKNALVLGRQDYQWKHEPCLYGWKDGASHYFAPRRDLVTMLENKPDIEALTKDELKAIVDKIYNGDIPTTVIDEAKPLRNAEHPTMKPVPLIGRLIKNSSRPGEIVLDMFGGSGTTLIAAEQLGRKCRMVELDPIYADVIIKRWEEFTGEKAQYVGNCLENSTESNS